MTMKLLHGNCIEVLKTLPENSVDSIVTDPPYGLAFMGKSWDSFKSNDEYREFSKTWAKEAYRVLKPGGYLLSFSGTRTYHWMAVGIEQAGFTCRDCIQWVYGSGFPKSHNISKSLDRMAGAERKVIGKKEGTFADIRGYNGRDAQLSSQKPRLESLITEAATDEAKKWDGYGTALKPANEPIMVAQKPISEKTIAANCLKWGVGALNIDGCRISVDPVADASQLRTLKQTPQDDLHSQKWGTNKNERDAVVVSPNGRWPANFIIEKDCKEITDLFPITKSGAMKREVEAYDGESNTKLLRGKSGPSNQHGDSGSAARFFYSPKTSTKERHAGLEDKNDHPTLKPIALMSYLVRLVTPHNGTCLDPFMGSGSTGIAALQENKSFIGIEMNEDYFKIAESRIKHHQAPKPIVTSKNSRKSSS